MKYKRLGGAGVKVSELCLGGMTFGEADEKSFMHKIGSDEQTAFRVMNELTHDKLLNFLPGGLSLLNEDGLKDLVK